MIVIDCTVDDKDLTLERLVAEFDHIVNMAYTNYEMSLIGVHGYPVVRVRCYPDQIWITQWQQDNIFSSSGEPHTMFRSVPLVVKFKELQDA